MKSFYTAFAVFLCVVCKTVCSQEALHTSRIRIYLPQSEIRKLRASGVEFDHGYYDFNKGYFENEFPGSEIQKLSKLGYKFEILVEDVARFTDSLNHLEDPFKHANDAVHVPKQFQNLRLNFTTTQNFDASIPTPSSFSLGSMGGFYNLTELNAQLDDMLNSYPGLVTKTTIGNTYQGRPIYVVKISDNAATDEAEPEVLYTGMHHAREGMSMMNLIFFMRFLLENYASNPAIKEIVDSRELFFIPVVNVDGFNYNTTAANWNAGKRMRRKTMTNTTTTAENADGSGGDGVDLNRNYPTYWGSGYSNGNTASSGTGSADAYRGSSAASEIETQNMMSFVNGRNFKMALNYHCYGNWWIRPEGPDASLYPAVALSAAAVSNYNSIAALFSKYNCYVYGTANQTVYDVNGYSDDWFFSDPSHSPIYAFSPEIGANGDGFWCPQSKILPYAKELVFPNIQAAYTAGVYAELQDTSDIAITANTGSFGYTVTRRGLIDGPVNVSIVPLNNIQAVGAAVTIPSVSVFGGQVSGGISYTLPAGIAAGTPIRFVWLLQAGGITTRDTVVKYYNPTQVFADNMEVSGGFATKWVTSSNVSANWSYETGTGLAGSASLTESKGGSYLNNADESVKLATALNLAGATQAYLTYMVKYATENCQDRLQVEISTTGVSGTYVPMVTNNTIKENRGSLGNVAALTGSSEGWVRELIDLTPYAGNTNVGLRFRFLSNGSNALAYGTDGFLIDNVKVIKSGAFLLPLNFEDILATRVNDGVVIRWKANLDETFARYTVQRSSDGIQFKTIAALSSPESSSFTDNSPQTGKNVYRVQLICRDGKIITSSSVTVVFETRHLFNVYPNPFTNVLFIEILSEQSAKATIEMISADGRQLRRECVLLKQGMNRYRLENFTAKEKMMFIIVRDGKGMVLHTQRLVKTESN